MDGVMEKFNNKVRKINYRFKNSDRDGVLRQERLVVVEEEIELMTGVGLNNGEFANILSSR
jgi:hypothetical protein